LVYGIGDSLIGTENGFGQPLFHLRPMLGDGAVVKAQGVGAETSTEILARLERDVIDHDPKPDTCIVLAGTNDVQVDTPAAAICANLEAMYRGLIDNDVRVIALMIYPFGNHVTWTMDREAIRMEVRDRLRERLPLILPEVDVVDVEDLLADCTDPSRPVIRAEYDDGTGLHLNGAGAMAVAREMTDRSRWLLSAG